MQSVAICVWLNRWENRVNLNDYVNVLLYCVFPTTQTPEESHIVLLELWETEISNGDRVLVRNYPDSFLPFHYF